MEGGGLLGAVGNPAVVCSYDHQELEDDDGLQPQAVMELPPGFRFHPTDEEIIMQYLLRKVMDRRFSARAIGEADLNKCEPWDLPKKAKMGEKEWFFFCQRDRKYPTGMRTNRATRSGYWKATGKDKEIYKAGGRNNLVGMKKTLVFYKGRAPKGDKTNWVMHEYRLEGNFSDCYFSRAAKEEWAVCRVFHKNTGIGRIPSPHGDLTRIDSLVDHLLDSPCDNNNALPPLVDYTCNNYPDIDQRDQNHGKKENFLVPHQTLQNPHFTLPNSLLPHQAPSSSLSYPHRYQDGFVIGSVFSSSPENTDKGFPYKRGDQARPVSPKLEHYTCNESVISQSQDTGLSTENMATANEITSIGDIESSSKQGFGQEFEGLSFIPNISDLDSLWNYC